MGFKATHDSRAGVIPDVIDMWMRKWRAELLQPAHVDDRPEFPVALFCAAVGESMLASTSIKFALPVCWVLTNLSDCPDILGFMEKRLGCEDQRRSLDAT